MRMRRFSRQTTRILKTRALFAIVREIPCETIPDRAEAVRYAVEHAGAGDIVLFAGKGHEQYQLVRGGKLPFSERRLIEETAAVCALAKVE